MRKQKKQLLSAISVLDFAAEGKCLAKHEGQVIFIDGQSVAPGDVVDLLVKQKKKNYLIKLKQDTTNKFRHITQLLVCGQMPSLIH